jgi:hypothetical protein
MYNYSRIKDSLFWLSFLQVRALIRLCSYFETSLVRRYSNDLKIGVLLSEILCVCCGCGWVGPRAGLDDVEKRKILPYI